MKKRYRYFVNFTITDDRFKSENTILFLSTRKIMTSGGLIFIAKEIKKLISQKHFEISEDIILITNIQLLN